MMRDKAESRDKDGQLSSREAGASVDDSEADPMPDVSEESREDIEPSRSSMNPTADKPMSIQERKLSKGSPTASGDRNNTIDQMTRNMDAYF